MSGSLISLTTHRNMQHIQRQAHAALSSNIPCTTRQCAQGAAGDDEGASVGDGVGALGAGADDDGDGADDDGDGALPPAAWSMTFQSAGPSAAAQRLPENTHDANGASVRCSDGSESNSMQRPCDSLAPTSPLLPGLLQLPLPAAQNILRGARRGRRAPL